MNLPYLSVCPESNPFAQKVTSKPDLLGKALVHRRALPKKSVYQSAKRTNDSSPAVYCWDKELQDL
jgi:hypothetical protein